MRLLIGLVIALFIVLWLHRHFTLGYIAIHAAQDLYAILSFEPLLVEEVMLRVKKSTSVHLANYFNSRELHKLAADEIRYTDQETLRHFLLAQLLQWMEKASDVEIGYEHCTLAWLENNKHRLLALSPSQLEEIYKSAHAAARRANAEAEGEGPFLVEEVFLVDTAIFVRKLPKGRKTPPQMKAFKEPILGLPQFA